MLEADAKSNWFLWVIGISSIVVITTSFYFLYFKKNYDFIVEVACNPGEEECFQRDCTDPDNCPPNQLSSFKRYSLNAADFRFCENEDCENACEAHTIECKQQKCVEDLNVGESCSSENNSN